MTSVNASRSERRAQTIQMMVDRTGADEVMIRKVVHAFYAKVRKDAFIGPIFAQAIGEDWDRHLVKMCDFWSSVMLMTGRYKGNPMVAHLRLKTVRPDHFMRWLELFHQTATEICPPETAEAFVNRSKNIARSLQLGMFYRPNAQEVANSDIRGAK